jgi:hypothetical protein
MKTLIIGGLALLWGCTSTGVAVAERPAPASSPAQATAQPATVGFSADEVRIIRDYYADLGTPGSRKGKSKGLPPGIAKNLARGKPLPPGIAKQVLPNDLLLRLPAPPDGYERIIVAGKILLIELGTQIVRDILTDVAFG